MQHGASLRKQQSLDRPAARFSAAQVLLLMALLSLLLILVVSTSESDEPLRPGEHRLWPIDRRDLLTLAFGVPALLIAAKGGVGGGGMLVPVYNMVLGFSMKHAIALTNITVLGGAVANVVVAGTRQHPQRRRPLIDWDTITVMEPLAIVGTIVGSLVNSLLPNLLLSCVYVVLFLCLAQRTITRGLALLRKHGRVTASLLAREMCAACLCCIRDESRSEVEGSLPISSSSNGPTLGQAGLGDASSASLSSEEGLHIRYGSLGSLDLDAPVVSDGQSPLKPQHGASKKAIKGVAVRKLLRRESRGPGWQPVLLALCFLGVIACQILRDSLPCGSWGYWLVAGLSVVYALLFFASFRQKALREYQEKVEVSYPFLPSDVQWDARNTLAWPISCMGAGVIAGLFGTGGGTVKGPLLLEMGLLPEVASATVSTMILFTAGSASVPLFLFSSPSEAPPTDYAMACFTVGLTTTATVALCVCRAGDGYRAHRQAMVVLSMGLVLALSALAMSYHFVVRTADAVHTNTWKQRLLGIGAICAHATWPVSG